MAEFDDLNLDKTPVPPPPPQPRWILIVAAAVLVLGLLAVWYYVRRDSDLDQVTTATEQALPRPAAQPVDDSVAADLPPLDESDALVRDMVGALSSHPIVASLLTTDQLIRTFAVSVMNVAAGDTPSRHLYNIKPNATFRTSPSGTRSYVDPRSYSRYDAHAAAVAGLDPRGAARLYERLKPRIQEAYREVAGSQADVDRALERAIVELLRTPVVEGQIAVEPRTVGYGYADPTLQSLSRAQQQLLRMGPENTRRVQEKLRAIARELGISEASLPPERVVRGG